MSNYVLKDSKEEREFLKTVRQEITKECKDKPHLQTLLDKSIEVQNKIWLIKNKSSKVDLPEKGLEQTAIQYIIFKKAESFLLDKLPQNGQTVADGFIDLLESKYYNLTDNDLENPNDGEITININDKKESLNAYSGIEEYIVNLDPDYAKVIENTVVSCYNKYNGKAEPQVETPKEESKDPVKKEELRNMTVEEIAEELCKYTVEGNELVLRKEYTNKNNSK